MISAADNLSQVIIAIADAMVALNAAFVKCKILHGNLSDQAIQFQKTADGVRGVLAEFDYAFYSGASPDATRAEAPELMLFWSIRSLERLAEPEELMAPSREYAQGPGTIFDDMESVLYTICVLGTFGINQAERDAYPNRPAGRPHIKLWNSSDVVTATKQKCLYMDTAERFYFEIAEKMAPGQLHNLAVEMHELLFLDPRCSGSLDKHGRCNPCNPRDPLVLHDPLVWRDGYVAEKVPAFLALMERHKREALVALSTTETTTAVGVKRSTGPSKKRKLKAAPETLTMKTRSMTGRAQSKN
ncbi:hypothetical protein GGH13_000057 [Coemansia sp. S155-1]|nr:hypothetical protein H4S03_001174 [Coemansia sp. S3946]KAJ2076201.1 hypothetical protein GGH13_000057 [Coemansia sp. S155-1]